MIDFKTGRVPASAAEIPASHRAQMAAYAEALAIIFPGRAVRSALLYTAGPRCSTFERLSAEPEPPYAGQARLQSLRRRFRAHGHQDGHRPELRRPTCSARRDPCWSISGRNGAARAG